MAKVVWIASFPRSGNTWARFLIANLLGAPVTTSREVMLRVPSIHRTLPATHLDAPGIAPIKTHWRYHPLLPLHESTVGAVYILRNPLDVVASAVNYTLLKWRDIDVARSAADRQAVDRWIENFIRLGSDPRWIELGTGSWDENVASWIARGVPFPRLILRYEDLRADPLRYTAMLARFLDLPAEPGRIATAVEHSSFDAMRAMEDRELHDRRPGIFFGERGEGREDRGRRFVNRGEVGAGAAGLSDSHRRLAIERFGAAMRQLGYLEAEGPESDSGGGQ